jgi:hypothetical protein
MPGEKEEENVGKPNNGEDHPHQRVLRLSDPRAVQCVSLIFGYETDSVQPSVLNVLSSGMVIASLVQTQFACQMWKGSNEGHGVQQQADNWGKKTVGVCDAPQCFRIPKIVHPYCV